ncbi:MAG: polysaccharide deacetylase family protein [Rhodoluna sp.]
MPNHATDTMAAFFGRSLSDDQAQRYTDAATAGILGLDVLNPAAGSYSIPRHPRVSPAVVVTKFQAGHGFTNNALGSANLNDTTDFVQGTQSVSIITDGAGTAKTIKRTGMTAFSATGRYVRVWVKVVANAKVAGLQLYLGDTSLANYYKWELKSSATQKWLTDGDWHCVTLSFGDATITGSPTRGVITDAQFRFVDDATGPINCLVNGIELVAEPTRYTNGVVTLTFDDSYASHYSIVKPKLDQYGMPATAFVIQDYIGASGRVTLAQLKQMQEMSGWEIAGHASTGAIHAARFTSLNAEQMESEAMKIKWFLQKNGFASDTIAYPGGEYNSTTLASAERHFAQARTVYQYGETLPPARRSKVRCNAYMSSGVATGTVTALIDRAKANKEWLVITFHDINSSPSASTDYSTTNFNTIIDYLATAGIPVETFGEVSYGLSAY